jgi:hypothetical protein
MSDLKIAVGGADYFTEMATTAVPVAMTAVTTTSTGNIMTITTGSNHGLTFSPASATPLPMPNYFVKFGGSGYTINGGTGVLLGNVFRILSIPSATTFTIYTTITSVTTTTSSTVIPVFYPVFQQGLLSGAATGTLASGITGSFASAGGYPYYGSVQCANLTTGANANVQYNPDNTGFPLDASTGNTPATAPTVRTLLAVSTNGQLRFGPYDYIAASGSSGTTYISIVA